MQKLYEIFRILQIQKRIVSAETICGNMVFPPCTTFILLSAGLFCPALLFATLEYLAYIFLEVLFTDHYRCQNFCPSLLRLLNNCV